MSSRAEAAALARLLAHHVPASDPVGQLARAYLEEIEDNRCRRRALLEKLLVKCCELDALREGPEENLLELMTARSKAQRGGE